MYLKQHGSELFVIIPSGWHCGGGGLVVAGGGGNRGASKPGDKQLGCEEGEE